VAEFGAETAPDQVDAERFGLQRAGRRRGHTPELALWPGATRKPGPRGQDRAPVPGS
jgi:hypothetical protein